MTGLAATKRAAREAAQAARASAHAARGAEPWARLDALLARHRGRPLSGYLPIRSEIDPRPAMAAHHAAGGAVGVPVIAAKATPLQFRQWSPEVRLVPGPFGAAVPETGEWLTPEILIVPLLSFDRRGHRLGYGGGFYDRTLAGLRAHGPVLAIGYAYAGQEVPEVPTEPTDAPLDLIVTEAEIITPA